MENENAAIEAQDDEIEGAAKRSIAFAILPSVIRVFDYGVVSPEVAAREVVKRAYEIAHEMIEQGESL